MRRRPGLRSHSQVADALFMSSHGADGLECPVVWKDLENKFFVVSDVLVNDYCVDLMYVLPLYKNINIKYIN